MRMLIDGIVTVFLILTGTVLLWSFITVELTYSAAQEYHSSVVKAIENSNFDSGVINKCSTQATEKGYILSITPAILKAGTTGDYVMKESFYHCPSCNAYNVRSTTNKDSCPVCGYNKGMDLVEYNMAMVKLQYRIKIPVIGYSKEGVVNGYAR